MDTKHSMSCPVCAEKIQRCEWEEGVWTYFPCAHERNEDGTIVKGETE